MMKKLLLPILFVGLINYISYAQDTIMKTNGDKLECKIQKEDSIKVFLTVKRDKKEIKTFIYKTDVDSVIYGPKLNSTIGFQERKKSAGRGTVFVSGIGGFINQGGEFFEDNGGNSLSIISLAPSINCFLTKNLFFGGAIEVSSQRQGDKKSNSIGFGPQLGFAFVDTVSSSFPYLAAGIRKYGIKNEKLPSGNMDVKGMDKFFSLGFVMPLKGHVCLACEGSYHFIDFDVDESQDYVRGKVLSLGIGIVGLFY